MMFLSIFKEASPNAYQRNKQSTPTPYRISPLAGEWIRDKHERSLTAPSFSDLKLAISLKG